MTEAEYYDWIDRLTRADRAEDVRAVLARAKAAHPDATELLLQLGEIAAFEASMREPSR